MSIQKTSAKQLNRLKGNESILIDSLGGLVEHHLIEDDDQWNNFQIKFLNCLSEDNLCIVVVSEEVGWGIVPATPIGHLFRERHSTLTSLISRQSKKDGLLSMGLQLT